MSTFGLTDKGFIMKRLDFIVQEKTDAVKAVFGDDYVVEGSTPGGQAIQVLSLSDSRLWQAAEAAANNADIDKAFGAGLSGIVKLTNTLRREDKATVIKAVTLTGSPNTVIPAGSLARTTDGNTAKTLKQTTIGAGGTVSVDFEALEVGPLQFPVNSLVEIVTPVAGWTGVTNQNETVLGQFEEKDGPLRVRAKQSIGSQGRYQIPSLAGALRTLDGVVHVNILDNKTDTTDADGVPARTFETIVYGGDDQEIGEAILYHTPFTVGSSGAHQITVIDEDGFPQVVHYRRPDEYPIAILLDITIDDDFPATGEQDIKDALVAYALENFAVGKDVIYNRLYTPINTVAGVVVDNFQIAVSTRTPTYAMDDIPISIRQIAQILEDDITINPTQAVAP